jgi:lipopolysaccharide export system permease protein
MLKSIKPGIIDLYIIKKFIITFLFSTGLFSLIAILIDISEKIDDFVRKKPALHSIIFDYYIYFLPWFYGMFGPIFVFLSCLFFNSRMAQNTEIIAILGSGVNYMRFLRPYLIGTTMLVSMFIYLNTTIIPISDMHRYAFEDRYIKDKRTSSNNNIHVQIEPGTMLYIESFNYVDSTGFNLHMERIEDGKMTQRIKAGSIRWNKDLQMWSIMNYMQRIYNGDEEIVIQGAQKDTLLPIKPSEFVIKTQYLSAMTNPELNAFIKSEREKGSSSIDAYYVELYRRIAGAVSFYPLTLLALAISSRKQRGGIGVHLGIGIFVTLTYLLSVQIFHTFGMNNVLHPAVAVWLPVGLFTSLSLILLYKVPK